MLVIGLMLEDCRGIKCAYLHAKMQTPGDVGGFLGERKGRDGRGNFMGARESLIRCISFKKKMQRTSDYLS